MVREDAVCALRAVALFVEGTWTIMMIGACFALGALTLNAMLAEKLLVNDRFSAAPRTNACSMGFAAVAAT